MKWTAEVEPAQDDTFATSSTLDSTVKRPGPVAPLMLCALGLSALAPCASALDEAVTFGRDEVARILTLGPWPPPPMRDPTNRVSGVPEAIALGRHLFFYPRFSPSGYVSCVACHQPDRAFTDNLPRARGLAPVDRNAIALQNLRLQRWYGWGGASDSLWMASLRPILDPREIGSSAGKVASVVRTGDGVACRYRAAFGADPEGEADETVLVNVGKALAAYEETLVTGRTPFDDLRDALARGERPAASYPKSAQRGLKVFVGRGGCVSCHGGPNFTDGAFRGTGVPPFVGQAAPDTGRFAGVSTLRASRFNLRGTYNDGSASGAQDVKTDARDRGKWRTPSLRNVAVSPPYLHNGTAASLYDVVRRYARAPGARPYIDDERRVRRVELSEADVEDLAAFLGTLTDADGATRPLPPPEVSACD
jgi:cytochrome c peroxidase